MTSITVVGAQSWCSACRAFEPAIAKASSALSIPLLHLDAEEDPQAVAHLAVSSLPTTILSVHGKEAARWEGAFSEPVIRRKIQEVVNALSA